MSSSVKARLSKVHVLWSLATIPDSSVRVARLETHDMFDTGGIHGYSTLDSLQVCLPRRPDR